VENASALAVRILIQKDLVSKGKTLKQVLFSSENTSFSHLKQHGNSSCAYEMIERAFSSVFLT
jgi:hypothetical protein